MKIGDIVRRFFGKGVAMHQYITYNKSRDPQHFYVEGSYKEDFIKFIKNIPPSDREWQPENKRWKIRIQHLGKVNVLAKQMFDKAYYSEGGDYTTL